MKTISQAQSADAGDILAFYEREGYWIEPDIFTPEECDRLVAAARELKKYQQGNYRPAMMPHRENPIFLKAMSNPKLIAMMEKLVGGTVSGLQTEFFYSPPGTRGFSAHQDNFFVEAIPDTFASAWCALTDTDKESGGLIAWPGSHKAGLLPIRKTGLTAHETQDPNANNEETVVPEQYQPVNMTVPKGAVLFIHSQLVHASNTNVSDRWRTVLLNTYIRKGSPFRAGKYAGRAEVDVYGQGAGVRSQDSGDKIGG